MAADLDAAIRAKLAADDGREADEIYWDAYRDAVLAALDLHAPDSWGGGEDRTAPSAAATRGCVSGRRATRCA